jgi:CTD nuclear envelope phosphatase 1
MNSLKTLSGFSSTPPASPPRSRTASEAQIEPLEKQPDPGNPKSYAILDSKVVAEKLSHLGERVQDESSSQDDGVSEVAEDERTPLIEKDEWDGVDTTRSPRRNLPKTIAAALVHSIRFVISAVLAPGRYVIACFYDEAGRFSALLPIRKLGGVFRRNKASTAQAVGLSSMQDKEPRFASRTRGGGKKISNPPSVASSAVTSDEEPDNEISGKEAGEDTPSRNTRSKSASSSGSETQKPARTIRISDAKADSIKRKKHKKLQETSENQDAQPSPAAAALLKSPTSPATSSSLKVTRYPRVPAPPRPLIPRRQPSYSLQSPGYGRAGQKTLIIDLDETLIHSMAKGGRMSTGHMVEVKLTQPVGAGGVTLGPQIPILYYVHKRPHCDDFLRKVSGHRSHDQLGTRVSSAMLGLQMVQPHCLHCFSTGVRRSCHRLA